MQQAPDTGQPADTTLQPQQPHNTHTRTRASSIPRPTVLTNVETFRSNLQVSPLTSPHSTLPTALDPRSRKSPRTALNGSPAAPQDSRSPYKKSTERPPWRTASGPPEPRSASSNPSPATRARNRLQKASFKDLVDKFNQSPDQEPVSPASALSPRTSNSTTTVSSPASRAASGPSSATALLSSPIMTTSSPNRFAGAREAWRNANEALQDFNQVSSPAQNDSARATKPTTAGQQQEGPASQPDRQPLFGEVMQGQADLSGLGYGIDSTKRRRGSEGSTREPDALFSHSRNVSNTDTLYPSSRTSQSSSTAERENLGWPAVQGRSKSDFASRSTAAAATAPTAAPASARGTVPTHEAVGSYIDSRSPTPKSSPSSRIPIPHSPSRAIAKSPNRHAKGSGDRRPRTPPSLQPVDGNAARIGRSPTSAQTLTAVINAPLPKKSPPLRSSRPRQDVHSARSISPSRRRGLVHGDDAAIPALPSPSVDLVSRQQSIRRAMMADRFIRQSWMEGTSPADAQTSPEPHSAPDRIDEVVEVPGGNGVDNAQVGLAQLPSTTYQRPGQNLKLNVPEVSNSAVEVSPNTAGTQFEDDETPSSGMPGTFPGAEDEHEKGKVPVLKPSAKQKQQQSPKERADQFHHRSKTILSQVMEMRRRRDTGQFSVSDSLSSTSPRLDQDDSGTIQIMLSDSPAPGQSNTEWHQQAVRNRESNALGLSPSSASGEAAGLLTPDSEHYAPINRILDQYHERGIVSPEMVQEFQKFILEVDPELSGKDEADTMEVARTALEDIIRDFPPVVSHHVGSAMKSPQSRADFSPESDRSNYEDDSDSKLRPNGDGHSTTSVSHLETSEQLEPTPLSKGDDFSSPGARSDRTSTSERTTMSDRTATSQTTIVGRPFSAISPNVDTPTLSTSEVSSSTTEQSSSGAFPAFLSPETSGASDSTRPPSDSTSITDVSGNSPDTSLPASSQVHPAFKGQSSYVQKRDPSAGSASADASSSAASIQTEYRRLTKRKNIIKELIDTENSYNQDMKVIEDIYKGTANACDAVTADDSRVLFGNSGQIVDFSEGFLAALKQAGATVYVMPRSNKWRQNRGSISTSNSNNTQTEAITSKPDATEDDKDRKTTIGHTFNQHISRMEELYTTYLRNHEYATQRLKRLQEISKVKLWLHECYTYAADITTAWDLDSLLVKPVQRVLKYPLLLKGLLETTPEDHPDYFALMIAEQHMTEASQRINESKKRAEVLDQVMKVPKRKAFDFGELVGRRSDKLKIQVGLTDAIDDSEYKRLAQKFETRFVHLQIVMRDFEYYKKNTEDFMHQFRRVMRAVEEMLMVGHSHSPELESKWRRMISTIQDMHAIAHSDHDAAVVKHCINPINTLIKLHEGPQKLMMKRKKRIVEFSKFVTMKNRKETIDKRTQDQGDQFIALNETLKDELPKLFRLSSQLVEVCLRNFIDLQKQWHSIWQRKVRTVLEEQQVPESLAEIIEGFNTDFHYVEASVLSLGICNGSLLADISNYLSSSSASLPNDENALLQRTSTQPAATRDEYSPVVSEYDRRGSVGVNQAQHTSGRSSTDSQARAYQQQHGQAYYNERFRAPSNASVASSRPRNSSARREHHNTAPATLPYVPHQESRQQWTSEAQASSTHHASAPLYLSQTGSRQRPISGSTFYSATAGGPNGSPHIGTTPTSRLSGVFSSAMPLSDSPVRSRPTTPDAATEQATSGQSEHGLGYQTLFTAASLYDFRIAEERTEGGYPYLFYSPGEIFDVIGQKGELWLAKNQDDSSKKVGWIWEKHFRRLSDD